MSKRLLLNVDGLKVSKSGYDVNTMTSDQAYFSSDFYDYNGLFMSGSLDETDFSDVYTGLSHSVVSFGTTLAQVPKVHAQMAYSEFVGHMPHKLTLQAADGRAWNLRYYVTTTQLEFFIDYSTPSPISTWDVYYKIFY